MKKIILVDPPEGWKYGFPKRLPHGEEATNQWFIDNGYPEKLIKSLGESFYHREIVHPILWVLLNEDLDIILKINTYYGFKGEFTFKFESDSWGNFPRMGEKNGLDKLNNTEEGQNEILQFLINYLNKCAS